MARNNDGWIKLQRDILDTDIFHHPLLLKIWIGILMSATWKETSILWQQARRKLAPGSLIFGMREFAQRVGISPSSLHRWIRYLHDSERITYETSARGSLITVVKWQEYQSSVSTVSTVVERSVSNMSTLAERSPNLKKKERKKEKNKNTASANASACSLDSGFQDKQATPHASEENPPSVGKTKKQKRTAHEYSPEFLDLWSGWFRHDGMSKHKTFQVYKREIVAKNLTEKFYLGVEAYRIARANEEKNKHPWSLGRFIAEGIWSDYLRKEKPPSLVISPPETNYLAEVQDAASERF